MKIYTINLHLHTTTKPQARKAGGKGFESRPHISRIYGIDHAIL